MSTDLGAVKRLVWLVTNEAGQPANPATATLTVTVGTAAPVTVPVTLPPVTTGTLIADYATSAAGLHAAQWNTTGPVSAGKDYFNVRSYVALCGLDEARDWLGYPDNVKDQTIRALLGASAKVTESVVGTCVIRQFTGDWIGALPGAYKGVLQLPHRPLPSPAAVTRVASVYSGLALGSPVWTTDMLIANPDAGTVYTTSRLPFWGGPWTADYTAGRTEIGENIVQGNLEILWDLFSTQRAMFADSADWPDQQQQAAVESLIPPGYVAPGHALELLEPDRMPAFG